MNVKDLWAYRDAVKAVHIIQENLKEYESIIYSARGPNPGRTPSGSCGGPDRFGAIADRHDKLLIDEENARLEALNAFVMLEAFAETLSTDEIDVFRLRYLKGLKIRDIGTEMHRSEKTVLRKTTEIKRKFEEFDYIPEG